MDFNNTNNDNHSMYDDYADYTPPQPLASQVGQIKGELPANPLLPKLLYPEWRQPVNCPLKDIQFVQIQRFKRFKDQLQVKMGDGFDQIGKKNMMRVNRIKRREFAEGKGENDVEAKMNENTVTIQNIVYARDPKVFDNKNGVVNQKNAFSHENYLDIRTLVQINQAKNADADSIGAKVKRPPPKIIHKTREQIEHEKALEAKAIYKLRTLPDGSVDPSDKTLLFESKFESGNLYLAQKVSDTEYNLLMQNDINTNGHTQWFFYQVKNTTKGMTVQFNINNFTKPDSLFNFGMKLSVYSEKMAQGTNEDGSNGRGWYRGGERISYFGNNIKKDCGYSCYSYYTLQFSYKFQHDDDTVYFAFCYPYTYTDLVNDLNEIELDPAKREICQRKTLCKTLSGQDCEILTITQKGDIKNANKKKAVVISARVHPGETVGSWMMRGVLNFLTDTESEEAKMLRERYVFKVIPMLNPDGVINGNYRCSLAGCDLNRRWKTPNRHLHPTIYHTKKLIKDLHAERGLLTYCDLHGHSRKQNVFMYGCNNKFRPEECRVFPLMLSKISQYFDFGSCRFGIQKSKESTARISLYKELKSCPNIFTMESTFSGVDIGDHKGSHMQATHFEEMGRDFCRTILIYESIYVPPEFEHIFGKIDKDGPKKDVGAAFAEQLANNKKLMDAGDGDSSGGSDSEPSEDNLPIEKAQDMIPITEKKDQKLLEKIRLEKKKKEALELKKQQEAAEKKRLEELAKQKAVKEQPSPTKRREPAENKDKDKDKDKKKKPEMKDAQTQTERSDYARIKKQQQARALMEMREQQQRMMRASNAQQQLHSQFGQFDGQAHKTPQSQTSYKGTLGMNYGAQRRPQGMAGGSMIGEKNLQDMRNNQRKYQFSQDKYGVQQNDLQNLVNGGSNNVNMINQLQQQLQQPKHPGVLQTIVPGNEQMANKSLVNTTGGAQSMNFSSYAQQLHNPNQLINMNNVPLQKISMSTGQTSQLVTHHNHVNQNGSPQKQGSANRQRQPDHFTELIGGSSKQQPPNLKLPNSNLSKVGEQILQANQSQQSNYQTSSIQSPTKISAQSNPGLNNRFKQQPRNRVQSKSQKK